MSVVAVPVRRRSGAVIAVASSLGLVSIAWPFLGAPSRFGQSIVPPLMFGLLLLLVLGVMLAELADGGLDAKAVALLGVLSAIGAALRPLGAGTAGIETVFFTLVLAGRVYGPGFGFVLGCTTIFTSALLTGGVGPWMPYQMFGAAWVGMGAGLLPPASGRRELFLLAVYGALSAYAYGLVTNLSSWPFAVDPQSTVAYLPGAPLHINIARYFAFDVTTSLGWDTGRAITTVVCLLVVGKPVLAALRRAARRAAFDVPVAFEPPVRSTEA
jgi:energy-coupling factor transport system substrate-specific component